MYVYMGKAGMTSGVVFVSVVYWLLALIVLFPPCEVAAAGLTIEALLGHWLGSESITLVQYHMRRTAVTLIIHTLLLPGYVVTLMKSEPWVWDFLDVQVHSHTSALLLLASLIPTAVLGWVVADWWRSGWCRHPLAARLAVYAPSNSPEAWKSVASDINTEFRRVDKFTSGVSSVYQVVATDNWLLKVTAYQVQLLHLRDAVLSLEGAHTTHGPEPATAPPAQLLTIKVMSVREGAPSFSIRLNSLEFGELERKIVNPVVNARHIVIQQSLSDFFLETFMETIRLNPPATPSTTERNLCFGCQQTSANVRLERRCGATEGSNGCQECHCRPMWCVSCLGKWFASRQDQHHPESWLGSRCPCPTCRSTFCLLDVSLIA
ncbi:Transmembrane protein 129 [Chionoecetes opilio]|uniref:Transmembrane protein 129 n=1 Tax=Chionoecetes opilio TaxID=41210 RepID=A0A8J5CDU7_CHIOP|nr:Transmembrane protein 129 [Chionoecetes opilio]